MEEIKTLINYNTNVPKRYVNKNLIRYSGFDEWININDLKTLQENIEKTFTEYVYPLVFVQFSPDKMIPENKLYKLRCWANVYRLYKNKRSDDYNMYYIYRLLLKVKNAN